MKNKIRTIWLLLIVLIYGAWAVTPVSAHALLLRSNPSANAVLSTPPVQVELFFSEALEPTLSSITVYDATQGVVDVGDVRVDPSDPTRMTVSLHSLADGVYTVSWKVVSAIDGHQTVGSFPFAVGNANATAVQTVQQTTSFNLPFTALLSKFLLLASLALLAGHRLFIALVWGPALRENQNGVTRPEVWKTIYHIGLVGVLLAIGVGILSQAGQTTGRELSLPWNLQVGRILTETRLGTIWLVRLALALWAVWLAQDRDVPWGAWSGFAVNLGLLYTITLTSHAATEAKPLLPILGDWIHLIGMTFWFGGLIYLFTGIRYLQQLESTVRTRLTSLVTSRFSVNAIIFVSLIGISGLYSASLRVGTLSALLDSLYGHVLLVKQTFVAALLIIAAINLLIISRRLTRDRVQGAGNAALVQHFGQILVVELTFAGLLLASVSFLTYLPPARTAAPVSSDFIATKKVDDLRIDIDISPAHVGQNMFMLMLSANGHPVTSTKEVLLRFTPSQANVPPSELQLIGDGSGMFMASGTHLSFPDNWQVQAVVRRPGKFDAYADFNVALKKQRSSDMTASPKQTGSLIFFTAVLLGLITVSVKAHRVLRFGIGLPLTVLMVGLGVYLFTRPVIPENVQANPIPANRDSIVAGGALYAAHCAACHGATGKGDGPVGLSLNPRPADLTQHAIPGVHTDAQLFEWITNGFPGSRMPAFKSGLSDTDRWNLVNFIRTFAPK